MLEELTHDEGFFGKAGSLTTIPEEMGEDGQNQDGEAPAEGEGTGEVEGEGADNAVSPQEVKFQYKTLKEYMVTTFQDMQTNLKLQMEKHEYHLTTTANKFQSVDKRVDIDLEKTIKELKFQADDMGTRLYNVQIE